MATREEAFIEHVEAAKSWQLERVKTARLEDLVLHWDVLHENGSVVPGPTAA